MNVHIRWMIRRDMPEVLNIEKSSFEFPWPEEDFIRCLRQRTCVGMLAEYDERVVGFMIYELHKIKIHILNFAVLTSERRHAVGQQMVNKLVGKLSQQRRNRIVLEIWESNLAAQEFFKAQGFRAIAVIRDYYDYYDNVGDAYTFQYRYKAEGALEVEPTNRITHCR